MLNDIKKDTRKELKNKLTLTYKKIADYTIDIEICRDDKGNCVYINPAFEKQLGYSIDDYKKGKITFEQIVHPDDRHIPQKYMSRLFTDQEFDDIEIRFIRKDNSIMYASLSSQPIVNENGRYLGRRTSIRDISQRKKAEQKLQAKEKKFREIFNNANDAIYIYNIDSEGKPVRYKEVNQVASEMLGYSKEEFLDMSPSDVEIPLEPKNFFQIIKKIRSQGYAIYEMIHVAKNGSYIPVEVSSHVLMLNGKEYIHSIARNITERKKIEKQLIKLSTTVKQSPSIIVITDLDGKIEYVNPKFTRLTGYSKEEVYGENPRILKSGKLPDRIYKQLWETISSGKEWHGEFLNKKKNEELYWEDASISPIFDDKGNIINYFKVSEDITKRKKAEKKLIQSIIETELFLNATTDGIWEWNFKTNELFFSDRYYTMLGYQPQEFKPTFENWLNLIHPDDLEHAKHVAYSYLQSKPDFYENEFRAKTKNGFYKWIHSKAKVVKRDENGEALRLIGSHEDITLRKQQQKKIIDTKNKLEEIIDNASELIVLVDNEYHIELWNTAAEKLTGISRKKVIGKSLFDLPIFENASVIKNAFTTLTEEKKDTKKLIIFRGKNGKKRLLRPSYSAISGKHIKGILMVGTDITEEAEKHGKILPGYGYILHNKDNKEAIPVLRHLLHGNKKGLFISRLKEKQMFSSSGIIFDEYQNLISEKTNNTDSLTEVIEKRVKRFCQHNYNGVIYFDRVDYILYHHSFDETLRLLYRLNEYVYDCDCVLIVRINTGLLNDRQLTAIREEFRLLPSRDVTAIELEDKLFSILMFIYEKQKNNCIVSFKTIKKEFSIVDVTVKKRLNSLKNLDLIYIKRKGRMKTIHITEKGRHLLSKREII